MGVVAKECSNTYSIETAQGLVVHKWPCTALRLPLPCIKVNNRNGIGIRLSPRYPGRRLGKKVYYGEVLRYNSKRKFNYNGHCVEFCKLADETGWIHNFVVQYPNAFNGVIEIQEEERRIEKNNEKTKEKKIFEEYNLQKKK